MHHNIVIITFIASANALMLESKLEAKFLGKIPDIGKDILEGGEDFIEDPIGAGEKAIDTIYDEAKMPAEYQKYQEDYRKKAELIEHNRAAKAAHC